MENKEMWIILGQSYEDYGHDVWIAGIYSTQEAAEENYKLLNSYVAEAEKLQEKARQIDKNVSFISTLTLEYCVKKMPLSE